MWIVLHVPAVPTARVRARGDEADDLLAVEVRERVEEGESAGAPVDAAHAEVLGDDKLERGDVRADVIHKAAVLRAQERRLLGAGHQAAPRTECLCVLVHTAEKDRAATANSVMSVHV